MGTVISVIIAIVVLVVLYELGVIEEALLIGFMWVFGGLITGLITHFFGTDFSSGWEVGRYIGLGFYGLACIMRIINNEQASEIITYDVNSLTEISRNKDDNVGTRVRGIIGLILLGIVIYMMITNR